MVKKILNAFTLLELSIVLVIMVILTSITVDFSTRFFEQNRLNNTQLKLKKIQDALNAYLVENGKLPCPAGLEKQIGVALSSCSITNSTDGVYVKDSVAKGWVPYETLDLTSDVAYDSWGNKISYMVANSATIDFYKIPNTFDGIKVYDGTESETPITNSAIYAIISHGKNGLGAYNKNNSQNSLVNISNEEKINSPVDLSSHKNNVLIYFEKPQKNKDDISIYSTKIQTAIDNDLENISSYVDNTVINNLLASYGLSSADTVFSIPSNNFLQYGDYIISSNKKYKIKSYKYGKLELVDQAKIDDNNNLESKCNKASLLLNNAIFSNNSGYINVGESVSFRCNECSTKTKTNLFATCLVGGLWSYNGYCASKTCNKSGLSYTNVTFTDKTGTLNCGDYISKSCNTGYTGSITATCNTSGGWSYSGSCTIITCENSNLSYSNTTFANKTGITNYNNTQTGSCNSGYTGTITATCQSNGTWNYSGSCAVTTCNYGSVTNGYWGYYDDGGVLPGGTASGTVPYGTKIKMMCNTGYLLSGTSVAECKKGDSGIGSDGWNWTSNNGTCVKLCDKDTLSPQKDGNIISTSPGVPGSKIYKSYSNAITSGTTYENGRYFANDAMIEANCSSGYQEISEGGQIDSTWGTHAYKCVSGEWKRMGTCFQGCKGYPTASTNDHLVISNNANDTQPTYTINGIKYYPNNAVIDTNCDTGYSEVCPSSGCNIPSGRGWNTWLQCENGSWVQKGSCAIKTCNINDLNNTTKINALTDTNIKNNTTNKNAIINSTFATSGTVAHNNTTTATGCESNYGGTKIKMKCYDGAWIWDTTNTTGEVAIVNTYNFTNGQQTWTVPSGVTRATFELWGAEGGGRRLSGNSDSGLGGLGGYVKATKDVSSGQTYYIYVGGKGNSSTSGIAYGGYNGGGNGYASSSSEPGNGGGGATDIRFGGSKTTYRILVAGGGGGGGEDSSDSYGHGGSSSCSLGSSSRLYDGYGTFLGDGGGGGGGYYGGYTSCSISTGSDTQGGCGGTNYTGGSGLYSVSSSSGIREGNGLAKITYYKQNIIGCVYNVGSTSSESSAKGSNLGYRSCLPSGSKVFDCTGSSQTWTVPDGVTSIKIQVWGAQGGGNYYGGKGGYSYGTLSVSSGNTVYAYVGCRPSSQSGGYNGGGSGVKKVDKNNRTHTGYGGGGATDIRYGGNSLSNRKIVAAGGGGGFISDWYSNKTGGYGGGGSNSGHDGTSHDSGGYGRGGTSSSGGSGGSYNGNSGTSGSLGNGGNAFSGGGGGGGYYGGGGGSGGDAGGSGGGGSGYIGGVSNGGGSSDTRSGNGVARICWGENADCDTTFNCQKSNISNPSNGIFDKSGTALYREIVYGSCNSGYSGTITATCNSDGSWSYSGSCRENCTGMDWNSLWNAFANTNPCSCACFQGLKTGDRWSYDAITSISHGSTWCGYVYTKANRGCSKADKDFNGYACWTCNDGTLTRSSSSCSWHDSC